MKRVEGQEDPQSDPPPPIVHPPTTTVPLLLCGRLSPYTTGQGIASFHTFKTSSDWHGMYVASLVMMSATFICSLFSSNMDSLLRATGALGRGAEWGESQSIWRSAAKQEFVYSAQGDTAMLDGGGVVSVHTGGTCIL